MSDENKLVCVATSVDERACLKHTSYENCSIIYFKVFPTNGCVGHIGGFFSNSFINLTDPVKRNAPHAI